jgi:hypothetical protein
MKIHQQSNLHKPQNISTSPDVLGSLVDFTKTPTLTKQGVVRANSGRKSALFL